MIGAPHPMFSGAPAPSMGASQYPPAMTQPQMMGPGGMTQMGMMPMGGMSAQSGFAYGVPQGPNIGSHIGAGMMGGMSAFGTGLGAMTMMGGMAEMMGSRNPMMRGLGFMDPMGAGMNAGMGAMGMAGRAGMGMAGQVGMGMAAGTGIGALAFAGTEAVRMAGGAAIGGFQQQQALNAQLSGMSFANPMSATGRGFDPGQQRTIGAGMRSFAAADPFTTMGDMQGMMSQFTDMGMAQGVRDAEEFTTKFKKMAETVRSMAMAMGTSLQEAAGTFGQMRQSGFFTASEVMGNTTQMNMLQGMGMSPEQFSQMQMSGAGMARNQGMLGQAGARGVTQMSQRLMLGMNAQREQLLMDSTGASDAAGGASVMAQRLTGGTQQFMQSGMGKAFLAATGEIKDGKFTGRQDQALVRQMQGKSGQELSEIASERLQGAAGESFVSQENMIRQSAMANQEGNLPAMMKLLENTAGGNENTMKILAKRFAGMDDLTFQFAKSLADNSEKQNKQLQQAISQELAGQSIQLEIARNRSIGGVSQRIKGGVQDIFSGTFGQMGANLSQASSQAGQDLSDQFFGISRTGVTSEGLEQAALATAFGAGGATSGGIVGQSGDFSVGRMGANKNLLGSVARGQGMAAAADVVAMAQGGGVSNVGQMLGMSEGRQGKLDKIAGNLKKNTYLRGLISEAQKARRDGKPKEVKRIRRQIDGIITGQLQQLGTEGGRDQQDQDIMDTAAILGKLDGNQLVAEQFKDEAGLASLDTFGDTKRSQAEMEARAQEAFGSKISGSRVMSAMAKGATQGMFGFFNTFMAEGAVGVAESSVQAIVTGGAGANVLAGAKGKEDRLLDIRAQADDISDEAQRKEFLAKELGILTGRTVTGEDAAAAMQMLESSGAGKDPKLLKELTKQASENEMSRGAGSAAAQAAIQAFSSSGLKGFDKELTAVRKGLSGGTLAGADEATRELVRAATQRGDLSEIAASGGAVGEQLALGAGRVRKVREGGIKTRAALAKEFGMSDEQLKSLGLSEELSKEEAISAAEKLAVAGVSSAATAGTQGVQFQGGMDPQVIALTTAQQVQQNAELISLVHSQVTDKDPIGPRPFAAPMDKPPNTFPGPR